MRSNGGAAGVDRHSIEAFKKEAEKNLVELEKILSEGNYRAKPAKRVWIPKIGSKETISHKTRRTSGEGMKCMGTQQKRLRGWYEYFKHSHNLPYILPTSLLKSFNSFFS